MAARRFQKREGKYALTAERDALGYFHLIANPNTSYEYDAGAVADADNFHIAIDEAEEEMHYLLEEARRFG